jgi:hypothetical protein
VEPCRRVEYGRSLSRDPSLLRKYSRQRPNGNDNVQISRSITDEKRCKSRNTSRHHLLTLLGHKSKPWIEKPRPVDRFSYRTPLFRLLRAGFTTAILRSATLTDRLTSNLLPTTHTTSIALSFPSRKDRGKTRRTWSLLTKDKCDRLCAFHP